MSIDMTYSAVNHILLVSHGLRSGKTTYFRCCLHDHCLDAPYFLSTIPVPPPVVQWFTC